MACRILTFMCSLLRFLMGRPIPPNKKDDEKDDALVEGRGSR